MAAERHVQIHHPPQNIRTVCLARLQWLCGPDSPVCKGRGGASSQHLDIIWIRETSSRGNRSDHIHSHCGQSKTFWKNPISQVKVDPILRSEIPVCHVISMIERWQGDVTLLSSETAQSFMADPASKHLEAL